MATNKQVLEVWEAWANEEHDAGVEGRAEALGELKDFFKRNDGALNLQDLGLTSIPDCLPEKLKLLDLSYNKLTSFDVKLPDGLERMYLYDSQLTSFEVKLPASAWWVDVRENNIKTLDSGFKKIEHFRYDEGVEFI